MKEKSLTNALFVITVFPRKEVWKDMLSLFMMGKSHTGALFVITVSHRKVL
jgi:hypothetical protein